MKEGEGSVQETKSVKFIIELQEDGKLSVSSPVIADTMFCLGLLEMAKAVVFQFKATQSAQNNIIRAKGHIMDFARKRFK